MHTSLPSRLGMDHASPRRRGCQRSRASLGADGDWAPLLAGQGLRMARRVQPAAEIVAELVERLDRVISFAGP